MKKRCCSLILALASSMALPRLVAAELPHIAGFELDGRFSASKWEGALQVAFTNRDATAYLARTDGFLFVGILSRHGRPSGKACTMTAHDDPVYSNDSAEVFVGVPGRAGYWHVIANANGAIHDDYRNELNRISKEWDSGARGAGSYDDAADRYYIEMRIPFAVFSPVEGKISLAVCSFTRWNLDGKSALGEYFKPETWTVFDLGARYPVVLEKMEVPAYAGVQRCLFTISNRDAEPKKLTGTFAGSPVSWDIGAGETRAFEAFNRMKRGESAEVALRLEADGRPILDGYRNVTARPLLRVAPVSDIIWEGEPLNLDVTVFERQTEPVRVEVLPGRAKCTYKGEEVEIPYMTDSSPWRK